MKKGQMIFEFIIAAVLFFAVVLYVINYLSTSVSVYSSDFYSNILHLKAIQASEVLLKNPGEWSGGTPTIVGLASASGWPILSYTKIQDLDNYCSSNYDDLLTTLGFFESQNQFRDFKLKINITEGESSILYCEPPTVTVKETVAHIKRFALSESQNQLVLDVWVW